MIVRYYGSHSTLTTPLGRLVGYVELFHTYCIIIGTPMADRSHNFRSLFYGYENHTFSYAAYVA